MNEKIVTIAIDLNPDIKASLATLDELEILKGYRVHLVHVAHTEDSKIPQETLRTKVIEQLTSIKEESLKLLPPESIEYKCIFSTQVYPTICDYIIRSKSSLAVVPSRDAKNTQKFNSLAYYLSLHCSTSFLVVR